MDKGPPAGGGVQGKWSTVMVAVTSEKTHTLKNILNVVGYGQLSSVLSSPVPPLPILKWACSFLHPCLSSGGTSTTPSSCNLYLPLSSQCPFLILCLLPLHSFPLSGLCFSSYQLHTFVSLQKNVYYRSHTFDSMNRWSRAGLASPNAECYENSFVCVLFYKFPT